MGSNPTWGSDFSPIFPSSHLTMHNIFHVLVKIGEINIWGAMVLAKNFLNNYFFLKCLNISYLWEK